MYTYTEYLQLHVVFYLEDNLLNTNNVVSSVEGNKVEKTDVSNKQKSFSKLAKNL